MRRIKRYRSWGITAKVMAGYILIALMVTVLAAAIILVLGYMRMRGNSLKELLREAQAIAQLEVQEGADLRIPERERMELYESLTESDVFFVDRNYVSARFSDEATEDGDYENSREVSLRRRTVNALEQNFIARILRGEDVMEARYFELVRGEVLFAGTPLRNESGEIVGAVALMQPILRFKAMARTMITSLSIAAAAALATAFFLSWRMSRTVTKPIVEITHTARRMGEGEYGAQVAITSSDEVGELGQTLNTLSNRVREGIEDLREQRDQLEIIIGSIGEGIVAVDTAGRVARYNQAFLELMEAEDVEQAEAGRTEGACCLQSIMRGSMYERQRRQITWINPSGRHLQAIASPLFGKSGEILGSVALITDVSESERLEKLRRDYVANISHELRTPLTGIRGMVEPLLDDCVETEEEKREFYQVIYRETLRLEKLISEMLDFSRLQDGRAQIETELLDSRGIVDAALRRVRPTAEEAGIQLVEEIGPEELTCLGNEDRILQVLTIFLDNALSFTGPGGKVTVYARARRQGLRMGVADTGMGIEPQDLPYIWERFYKSDKSRMRTSGTGLGLAIAKQVVELMGGEIGVCSQPGWGSDFYFTLKRE